MQQFDESVSFVYGIKLTNFNSESNYFMECNMLERENLNRKFIENEREKLLVIMNDKFGLDINNLLSNINTKRKGIININLMKQLLIEKYNNLGSV